MSNWAEFRKPRRSLDIFIVIIFLVIAVIGVELFRRDLLQTFRLQNTEPVGVIIVKRNIVQRRLTDRVVWDRLVNESPVYMGDLIRVAEISAATLTIDANIIDINENTLIRIARAADGDNVKIFLNEGSFSLAAEDNSKSIIIDINGQQLETERSTVLNAAVSEDRQTIQVIEGKAQFISSGGTARELTSGSLIAMDTEGKQRLDRGVVINQPLPNARIIKTGGDPQTVNVSWNRVNLESNMLLRMEIAQDSGFSRITRTINNLDRNTQTQFDEGLWYYRVLYQDEVLGKGQLSVIASSALQLVSPAVNSLFQYNDALPSIAFQWTNAENAVSYVLQISSSSSFNIINFTTQVSLTSQTISLGEGRWFWRVQPVYPDIYNNRSSFSKAAFFSIEKTEAAGMTDASRNVSVTDWIARQTPSSTLPADLPPDFIPERIIEPALPEPELPAPSSLSGINLLSPENGAQIDGLTALRRQISFNWNTEADFISSRFIISRNVNPLQAPIRVIHNPAENFNVDNLADGLWYWTIEIQTEDGRTVSAAPRRLQITPVPLLPAPRNLQPPSGIRLGNADLAARAINFRWASVQGANAYIFTLYQRTQNERRQVIRETINSGTGYTLNNIRLLNRGTFVWSVEPVNTRGSQIEQRGNISESTFIIDIPILGPVQIDDTGILYGN